MYTHCMPVSKIVLSSTLILTLILTGSTAFAEMARGTATTFQTINDEAKPGDIVSYKAGQFLLSKEPFDTEQFGVVVETSSITLVNPDDPNGKLIMQSGEAQINISTSNGAIKKGDYITSSKTPGIGQKADKSGFVVGKALADAVETGNTGTGTVRAVINPQMAVINSTVRTNLIDAIRSGALSPLLSPIESLRYVLAALIVASTFIIGFSTFGKTSGRTIEALGRNPLAGSSIRMAMVFNTVLAFGVMLIGLALAYLILVL